MTFCHVATSLCAESCLLVLFGISVTPLNQKNFVLYQCDLAGVPESTAAHHMPFVIYCQVDCMTTCGSRSGQGCGVQP